MARHFVHLPYSKMSESASQMKANFYIWRLHITKTCPYNIRRFSSAVKFEIFMGKKKRCIFNRFAQNIDCGYPQTMFWIKNKKNRYTHAYPSYPDDGWAVSFIANFGSHAQDSQNIHACSKYYQFPVCKFSGNMVCSIWYSSQCRLFG